MKPSKIAFTTEYSDGSGTQHRVEYIDTDCYGDISGTVEIEHIDTIKIGASMIPWLINALRKIELEIAPTGTDGEDG